MTLGDRLVEVRTEQGMEVKDFSDLFEVTTQTYHNWVNGKSYPEVRVIIRILELFPEYNALWLLLGEGEKHRGVLDAVAEPSIGYPIGWKAKIELLIEGMSGEIKSLKLTNEIQKKELNRLAQEILGIIGNAAE